MANPPQQQHNTPQKSKTEDTEQPVAKSIEDQFRDALAELIVSVISGTKSLKDAKLDLHEFIDLTSEADKEVLRFKVTGTCKRVRDIAESLSSEAPSLIAKMQTKES